MPSYKHWILKIWCVELGSSDAHTSPMMEVATPIMAARETKSSLDLVKPRLMVFSPTLNCWALMSLPATSFFAGVFVTACRQPCKVA